MTRIPLKTLTLIGCDSFGRMSLIPELGVVECVDPARCSGVAQLYPLARVLQMGWEEPAIALLDVPWLDAERIGPKRAPTFDATAPLPEGPLRVTNDVQPQESGPAPASKRARGPQPK